MVGYDLLGAGGEQGDQVRQGQGDQVAVGCVVQGLRVHHRDNDNHVPCISRHCFTRHNKM